MGNHSCVSSRGDDDVHRHRKKSNLKTSSQHFHAVFLPRKSDVVPLTKENLDKLYKKIIQPYQLKVIPFSYTTIPESEHSLDPTALSIETSFRLHSEAKLALENLPLNLGSSTFVFLNENDPMMMKVMIAGAAQTPYAHGLFEFNVYLQEDTSIPLKVEFCTTGYKSVSFSTYLPTTGIVDISHITQISRSSQDNIPGNLNLPQLLSSLQNLLKTDEIFKFETDPIMPIDEPKQKARQLKAYSNVIKYANIQYAMLKQLEDPPFGLKDFLETYFSLKKDCIFRECNKWLAEAQLDDGYYDDIVAEINPELAKELRNGAYFVKLNTLLQKLEQKLMNIKLSEDSNKFKKKKGILGEKALSADTI